MSTTEVGFFHKINDFATTDAFKVHKTVKYERNKNNRRK